MKSTNKEHIPEQTRPRLTTSAPVAGKPQGDGALQYNAKNATGGQITKLNNEFVLGRWNVRTLYATGKLKKLCYEMDRYRWNVLGLCEVRWSGAGKVGRDEGHKLWYCGEDRGGVKGVGFLVHKDSLNSVLECRPISSRIISIRLSARPKNLSTIQVYAQTSSHTDEKIESFYQDLSTVLKASPEKDITIIQGDWNAKVGPDAHDNWASMAGKYGRGETNERGLRLLEFARYNKLVLANTLHPHKPSRRVMWLSPNVLDHNQIDYILVPKRFASGIIEPKHDHSQVLTSGAIMS